MTITVTDNWQSAAMDALCSMWFGSDVVAARDPEWIAIVEDNLPTLDEVRSLDKADLWSMFRVAGFITIVNSQLDMSTVHATVIGKQRDYGHGNILKFGLEGVVVRLSDKIERFKNLTARNSSPSNESLADTQLDIVGYCMIALMLLDGTFTLELAR